MPCFCLWSAVVTNVVQAIVVKHVATHRVVLSNSLPTLLCDTGSGPDGSLYY